MAPVRPRAVGPDARGVHGFRSRDGIDPLDLLALGRAELAPYGVGARSGRAVRAHVGEGPALGFHVTVENGEGFRCRRLLLASGPQDRLPQVEGVSRFYGRGVHHCPYCDGEARGASGGPSPGGRAERARPTGPLTHAVLASGEVVPADAVFFAGERVQHSDLAGQLGCELEEDGSVRVAGAQRTTVPGVFLAGDAAGDVQFAVVAASEGARAAVAISEDLEEEDLS